MVSKLNSDVDAANDGLKISGELINPPSAFVDEDLAFLAKIFSALDQVLQADWVAGGMQAVRVADLIERMRTLVGRVIAR